MTERHGERRDHPVDEPAPTLTSKARSDVWVLDRRTNSKAAGGGMEPTVPVEMNRPAPTLTGKAGTQWTFLRPATTVQGDPRIGWPGHKNRDRGEAQFEEDSVRITVEEALILQSFRRDYPLHGSKSKRFEQVGNAVPPALAALVIASLTAKTNSRERT